MYRRILVGYDGSAAGRRAFEAALNLASTHGAELHVLTVCRTLDIGDDVESEAVIEHSREYHRRLLAELESVVPAKGVKAQYEVAVGHPAEQIMYCADKQHADLIVVGDRGRSKFAKLLLGSTSKSVVEHANRAVLVVR
jgi:nucleotide-binding universal stress UspA family protein